MTTTDHPDTERLPKAAS